MGGEQPRWATCSHDDCIGRRISTTALCLAHAAEEAPDAFDAELKRIGEEGTVDLRGVVINAELLNRLLAAAPQEDNRPAFAAVHFDRATFQDGAWFTEAAFHGEAVFTEATFEDDAGFAKATFHREAVFVKANFPAEAEFDGATFDHRAWFAETIFHGEAGFDGVTFHSDTEFFHATFQDWTRFAYATFRGEARFFLATFHDAVDFSEATFQGRADFHVATFQGNADFERAAFHGEAMFREATFQREARFAEAAFRGRAGFAEAAFRGRAGFDGVSFQDLAWFGGATFQGQAWFHRASFERATQLGPLLARQLVLDGAVFGARVQLDATAAAVCARRAQFPAGAHLRLRYATVDLDDANLAAPAIIAGVPSPFPWLEEQLARGWARLPPGPRQQRWRPRLLSVRRADVAGLRLADVDLRACRFAGAHNLDRLRIEGPPPLFAPIPGWWRARRKALAEEHHWRANRPGRWPAVGWYPRACQPPASPKAEAPAVVGPTRLAVVYRELRKGREDAKDEPGAADFYYGEMEMRRLDRQRTVWPERVILWLYWLVSGYGLRGLRALASLVVVIVGLAALLQAVGFNSGDPGFRDVVIYAAQTTISMPSGNQALTEHVSWAGEVLRIVLRLAGPVLLGLTLLAIRGRVRR